MRLFYHLGRDMGIGLATLSVMTEKGYKYYKELGNPNPTFGMCALQFLLRVRVFGNTRVVVMDVDVADQVSTAWMFLYAEMILYIAVTALIESHVDEWDLVSHSVMFVRKDQDDHGYVRNDYTVVAVFRKKIGIS